MGKSYFDELNALDASFNYALTINIDELFSYINNIKNYPLISIGSGGSLTSAVFHSLLHQRTGNLSQFLTPLTFSLSEYKLNQIATLLISAGGNNKDIIDTINYFSIRNSIELGILCGKKGSKLALKAKELGYTHIFEYDTPNGKDGFLAVNSLLIFSTILTRSYKQYYNLDFSSLSNLIHPNEKREDFLQKIQMKANKIVANDTFIILYGKWSQPAAYDLESKFHEIALANVQICDYRNFGHGRHYWLDKRRDHTAVICLFNNDEKNIAEKTIELIPEKVPIAFLSTELDGPQSGLNLLVQALFLFGYLCKIKQIDPGKPSISDFGKKFYHLGLPKFKNSWIQSDVRDPIPKRNEANSFITNNKTKIKLLKTNCNDFINKINNTQFSGVIFDYDGTICANRERKKGICEEINNLLLDLLKNGVYIGIATGRGKSIRVDLQSKVDKKYWPKIIVGYYNGSDVGFLDNDELPNKKLDLDSSLSNYSIYLHELNNPLTSNFEIRPKQISIFYDSHTKDLLYSLLTEAREITKLSDISILDSGYSFDILAPDISKLNVYNFLINVIKNHKEKSEIKILCVGDQGHWPGNDYFLLSTPYSISVDSVSDNPSSCWNIFPSSMKNVEATLKLFKNIKYDKDGFNIIINEVD